MQYTVLPFAVNELVEQAAQVRVAVAARVMATMIFFISVLQVEFSLIWRTVVFHLDSAGQRRNQVILTCLAYNKRCVCDMHQGLPP